MGPGRLGYLPRPLAALSVGYGFGMIRRPQGNWNGGLAMVIGMASSTTDELRCAGFALVFESSSQALNGQHDKQGLRREC
jgi:hypothetical protein